MSSNEFSDNIIHLPTERTNSNTSAGEWKFVAFHEIMAHSRNDGVKGRGDSAMMPQDARYNADGRLTEYAIGEGTDKSSVKVEYQKFGDGSSVISKLEIKRPGNKENIVYKREQGDAHDRNAPFVYSEQRDGIKGDLLFSGLALEKNGRVNVYINRGRLAITFNPKTGAEELP